MPVARMPLPLARALAALALLASLLLLLAGLAASPARAAEPSCGSVDFGTACDAYWWDDTMGDVAVSKTKVEPGGLLTVTATVGTMHPYWSNTDQGWIPSGVGSVKVSGLGEVVSFSPGPGDELNASANAWEVSWSGIERNPPGQGLPTSTWGQGKQFTVTYRVPKDAWGGQTMISADWRGRRGFLSWGAEAQRFVDVGKLPDVTLSGRATKEVCEPVCTVVPAAGETVSVNGTSDVGDAVARGGASGPDGRWSVKVPRGTYTVGGPAGMEPASRDVTASGDVDGLDFHRAALPMPLPPPPPPPPPPVEGDNRPPQPPPPGAPPCTQLCLPQPQVLKAAWKATTSAKAKSKAGAKKPKAKASASGGGTRPAALRVLVKGQPGIRYGLHLVEGTKCTKDVIGGTLRALVNVPATVGADGTVKLSRDVNVAPGRFVTAYITDGRDRSPYAPCKPVTTAATSSAKAKPKR